MGMEFPLKLVSILYKFHFHRPVWDYNVFDYMTLFVLVKNCKQYKYASVEWGQINWCHSHQVEYYAAIIMKAM